MADNSTRTTTETKKVTYLHIESDGDYFNTKEQIRLRNIEYFTDYGIPGVVSGSVAGLFSRRRPTKDDVVYNSPSYATSSTVTDPSGASRKILSLDNDYIASSSIDSYKNGVEVTQEKHWTAGLFKITAGTPGHLIDRNLYGVPVVNVVGPNVYADVGPFNPVWFVKSGGDPNVFSYPIVVSDVNLLENYTLDGIIEPFAIRPVVSNYSVNFPFEPHSMWADMGNGNIRRPYGSDQVVSVDYVAAGKNSKSPFLDAGDAVSIVSSSTGNKVYVGPTIDYVSTESRKLAPFVERSWPWNTVDPPSTYSPDMIAALAAMPSGSNRGGTTYVGVGQRAATSGFVYDDATMGTDSIAFGGRLY